MNKPLILITNDDGIKSPGLMAAAEAAANFGDILIAAPHMQQTGMGRAFPRGKEVGIIDRKKIKIGGYYHTAYAVHGSPAYAVAHGVLEIAKKLPDLCISGINYGENLGLTLTCSGTLGAVFEAGTYGIPGIAVSVEADINSQRLEEFGEMDWKPAQEILKRYIVQILEKGMPKDIDIWNINVPAGMKEPYKYRITTQSRQNYFHFIRPPKRDFHMPYGLKSRLYVEEGTLEKDSDIYAVYKERMISVTPISMQMSVKM